MLELETLIETEIDGIQSELSKIEANLYLASSQFYGNATPFPAERFKESLANLKSNLSEIQQTKPLTLQQENLCDLKNHLMAFKASFEPALGMASKASHRARIERLQRIKQDKITKENKIFHKAIQSLLSDKTAVITHNKFNELVEQFYGFSIISLIKELEKHVEKLSGTGQISLWEKLTNFIYSAITQEKIQLEQQGINALNKIKNCLENSPDTVERPDELQRNFKTLRTILENETFAKPRRCSFYKPGKPVTSKIIATAGLELLNELAGQRSLQC